MTTMKVSQKIEFPTVYSQKNKLAKLQQSQYDREFLAQRTAVLGLASSLYIQRISLMKIQKLYAERLANAQKLLQAFEQKLAKGDANILEVNKLKLELSQARKEESLAFAKKSKIDQQLELYNAGQKFEFTVADYPTFPETSEEELVQLYRENDPELRLFAEDVNIAFQEIRLQENKNLPELSFSYGYEKTPDVRYAGPGASLSIPLWQNKNRVKLARSNWEFSQAKLDEETMNRENEIRWKAKQLLILKTNLDEMRNTLNSINSVDLLGKAMNAGEISIISYLNEIQYYYLVQTELFQLEQEYYQLLLDINRIRL
jgi:outer membrane protein TolC